jgi:hypothetical protein
MKGRISKSARGFTKETSEKTSRDKVVIQWLLHLGTKKNLTTYLRKEIVFYFVGN